MKCQFCNTELENDALFCHECGAKTGESPAEEHVETTRTCSNCGAELSPEAKFCGHCGIPTDGQSPVQNSDQGSRASSDQIRAFTEKVTTKIKEKPKQSAIIAAIIVALIVLLVIVSSLPGGNSAPASSSGSNASASASSSGSSSSYSSSSTGSASHSDDYYELIATRALYDEIQRKYKVADAGSTKYSINKTEKKGSDTILYGKLYLYDKYGKSTTGHADGSGSYIRTFTVKINNSTGKAVSCTIQ